MKNLSTNNTKKKNSSNNNNNVRGHWGPISRSKNKYTIKTATNKPGLKLMRHERLVQVPSVKTTICGQAPPVAALRCISFTVSCRELGFSLSTSTGCVNLIRANKPRQQHSDNQCYFHNLFPFREIGMRSRNYF